VRKVTVQPKMKILSLFTWLTWECPSCSFSI